VDIDDPPTTLKYIENSCDAQQNMDVNNVGIICFKIKNPLPVELCWQKKRNP
jgi:hypothetical protein